MRPESEIRKMAERLERLRQDLGAIRSPRTWTVALEWVLGNNDTLAEEVANFEKILEEG